MKPYYEHGGITIYHGNCIDVLRELPDEFINCCVTSPPYWGLRDYEVDGQFGVENTLEEYVERMVEVFREVRRVLRKDAAEIIEVTTLPYLLNKPATVVQQDNVLSTTKTSVNITILNVKTFV